MREAKIEALKVSEDKLNDIFNKNLTFLKAYNVINKTEFTSFKEACFQADLNEIKMENSTLSVIISIIERPHLANSSEIGIVKAGQVSSLDNNLFKETTKDASLWSKRRDAVLPKEVYYRLSTDDLAIYENFFIIKVIKMIEADNTKYLELFSSFMNSLKENSQLSLSSSQVSNAFLRLKKMQMKLRMIEETNFFKMVSRVKCPITRFEPTNILIHDALYNSVYKSYKKMLALASKDDASKAIYLGYLPALFKALKNNGFTPTVNSDFYLFDEKHQLSLKGQMLFVRFDFILSVTYLGKGKLEIITSCLALPKDEQDEKTLVSFNDDFEERDEDSDYSYSPFTIAINSSKKTTTSVSLATPFDEMDALIKNLILVKTGSKEIYSLVCPNCLGRNIKKTSKGYTCLDCLTSYSFYPSQDKDTAIWIRNFRGNNHE
mgnify:CR=1 FL=1|jgi:hypothetical protein